MNRWPPWMWIAKRRGVECVAQPGRELTRLLLRRARQAGRRHGAFAKLAIDLLPSRGTIANLLQVRLVEQQSRGLLSLVVAGHAVTIEELPVLTRAVRRRTR